MLLTNLKDTTSNAGGLSGAQVTFDISPRDLMMEAFDVPLDNVVTVKVRARSCARILLALTRGGV